MCMRPQRRRPRPRFCGSLRGPEPADWDCAADCGRRPTPRAPALAAGDTYLREWAVWSVRNLCEVSCEAAAIIAELQPQGVEQSGDLARMGVQVAWDEERRKPVIKQLPRRPAAAAAAAAEPQPAADATPVVAATGSTTTRRATAWWEEQQQDLEKNENNKEEKDEEEDASSS